jgi:transcriptional regulator with XRE-family HTH domain
VQKYETGETRISVSRLFDIAEALGSEAHVIVKLTEFDLKAKKEF